MVLFNNIPYKCMRLTSKVNLTKCFSKKYKHMRLITRLYGISWIMIMVHDRDWHRFILSSLINLLQNRLIIKLGVCRLQAGVHLKLFLSEKLVSLCLYVSSPRLWKPCNMIWILDDRLNKFYNFYGQLYVVLTTIYVKATAHTMLT